MSGTFTLEKNPLGYRQLTVSTTAVGLANATGGIPAGATRAVVQVEAQPVRWRDDGSAPTLSVGVLSAATDMFELPSLQSINNFKAIRSGAADGTLNIRYYGA